MLKKHALLFLIFLSGFSVYSQGGWQYFENNNHIKAKEYFQEQLKEDKNSVDALKALLILSEFEKDKIAYERYAKSLIESSWNPFYYFLFENIYGQPEEVVRHPELYPSSIINAKQEIADSLFRNRKFEISRKIHESFVQSFNWSIIGSFKNEAGSGFEKKYEIESDSFDPDKSYSDKGNMPMKWVEQINPPPDEIVIFDRYLENDSRGNVYYANTFFSVGDSGSYSFRLGRNCPMKIWLDDHLIFTNNDNAYFYWDSEVITLNVKPGTHRILVKCASYPESINRDFLSFYDFFTYSSSPGYNVSSIFSNINFLDIYRQLGLKFSLRITKENPFELAEINSFHDTTYSSSTYLSNVKDFDPVAEWKDKTDPSNIGDYYFLAKAFFVSHNHEQGEQYFAMLPDSLSDVVLIKYLKAKLYSANSKNEKAYAVLNNINDSLTPIFDLTYKRLQELDQEEDEAEYLKVLSKLNSISPSNWKVINNYIDYYGKKGLKEDKTSYINSVIDIIPEYKEDLEKYLEDDSYKPYDYKPLTDKEKKAKAKESLKKMKSKFEVFHYERVIEYYDNNKKSKKAIALYDELIETLPHDPSFKIEKANMLYKMERYDEALSTLNAALEQSPFNPEILENIGDVYFDKKMEDSSLYYYKQAKEFTIQNTYSLSYRDLDEKIKKIENIPSNKDRFSSPTFKEILAEEGWKSGYSDEDALILMYNKNIIVSKEKVAEVYQELMLQIKTPAGAKSWTEADFSFFGNLQSYKVIKNNGSEVIPDEDAGYLVFKNLEPGDIIQVTGSFKWTLVYELEGEFAMVNYLNFDAPSYKTRLEIIVPENSPLNILYTNIETSYDRSSRNGYNHYVWKIQDLEKVQWENALVDNSDVYATIMVSSMNDWSEVVDWYQDKTYRKIEPGYETDAIISEAVDSTMTEKEMVIALYNHITKEINYSYVPFLNSNFIPKDPGRTCSSKIGDCKDVATLMITMLRKLGIESYFVLVKTNQMNHQYMLPSLLFDHVIVGYKTEEDSVIQFLDLTTDYYPYYALNEQDAGAWALIIKDGENEIFQLPNDYMDPEKNLHEIEIEAKINTDRSISMQVKSKGTGLIGGYFRENMNLISEEEKKNFILDNFGYGIFDNLVMQNYDLGNLNEITAPHIMEFSLLADNFADKVGRMLVFRIPFMKAVLPNPAIYSEKRNNRLNIEALLQVDPTMQEVLIKAPKGYRFDELPEDVSIENKFGKYLLSFQKVPQGVKVRKIQYFNNKIIEKEDFDLFKKYYLKILDADGVKLSVRPN